MPLLPKPPLSQRAGRGSACARRRAAAAAAWGLTVVAPRAAIARAAAHAHAALPVLASPLLQLQGLGPLPLGPNLGSLRNCTRRLAEGRATTFNHALVAHAQSHSTAIARHDSLCYDRVRAAIARRPSSLRCAQFTAIGRAALVQQLDSPGSCTLLAGRQPSRASSRPCSRNTGSCTCRHPCRRTLRWWAGRRWGSRRRRRRSWRQGPGR